jgi:hypothetical protein
MVVSDRESNSLGALMHLMENGAPVSTLNIRNLADLDSAAMKYYGRKPTPQEVADFASIKKIDSFVYPNRSEASIGNAAHDRGEVIQSLPVIDRSADNIPNPSLVLMPNNGGSRDISRAKFDIGQYLDPKYTASAAGLAAIAAATAPRDANARTIPTLPWRPIGDVAQELGVKEIAPHTQDFAKFMNDMHGKIASEGLSDRDLMKAYGITASSIGRTGRTADAVRRGGLDIVGNESVRPEGAFGLWLMTPHGQAFLNDAQRGVVNEDALANLTKLFGKGEDGGAGFGKQNQLADQLREAVSILPGHKDAIEAALMQPGHEPLREAMMALPGVNASKAGFISSLLGNGAMPTLDARQIILHTGDSTENASKVLSRKGAAAQAVDELAARQAALGLDIAPEFAPNYQHLAHHTIWDKVSNTKTTHQDLVDAMKKAGIAGLATGAGAYALGGSGEAEAAKPPSLTPAIVHNGKVYKASNEGGTHLDALRSIPIEERFRAETDGNNRMYVTPSGKVLDRYRAQDYALKNDLHSEWSPSYAKTSPELVSEWLADHREMTGRYPEIASTAITQSDRDILSSLFDNTTNRTDTTGLLGHLPDKLSALKDVAKAVPGAVVGGLGYAYDNPAEAAINTAKFVRDVVVDPSNLLNHPAAIGVQIAMAPSSTAADDWDPSAARTEPQELPPGYRFPRKWEMTSGGQNTPIIDPDLYDPSAFRQSIVSPELAAHVNLPQAVSFEDAPRFEYSPEQFAQFQAMFPEAKGYADGGEIVAPESTAAPVGFHGGIFYTGDATAPAAGPFVDNTIGQPFHGGNFYTGEGTPAPQSFTPPAAGSPFHGGIFYTAGDSSPVAPTPSPVVDTGYWTNPIAATQTYYPSAAFDATSPSGYFNYAHNFIQGDKAPGGFTTWAPYVEPPPPQPGYSEGG